MLCYITHNILCYKTHDMLCYTTDDYFMLYKTHDCYVI